MDKTNSKVLTISFALAGALAGLTLSLLIKILAGVFGVVARLTDAGVIRDIMPAIFGLAIFAALQFTPAVNAWGEEVVTEIRKVVFPTGKETTSMTIVVVVFVAIASAIITFFDLLSGQLMNLIVK